MGPAAILPHIAPPRQNTGLCETFGKPLCFPGGSRGPVGKVAVSHHQRSSHWTPASAGEGMVADEVPFAKGSRELAAMRFFRGRVLPITSRTGNARSDYGGQRDEGEDDGQQLFHDAT
ncbi:hypothetical protein GCM10022268_26160 [Sphingomonas cynarae]|uniref:Uncharacterized protein n=1 Tax=Sphingomonas cynarae TaxID=930197 RepID=A0ABP7EC74_9SPHN